MDKVKDKSCDLSQRPRFSTSSDTKCEGMFHCCPVTASLLAAKTLKLISLITNATCIFLLCSHRELQFIHTPVKWNVKYFIWQLQFPSLISGHALPTPLHYDLRDTIQSKVCGHIHVYYWSGTFFHGLDPSVPLNGNLNVRTYSDVLYIKKKYPHKNPHTFNRRESKHSAD